MKYVKTLATLAITAASLGIAGEASAQAKHGYRGGGHGHSHGHRHWSGPRLGFYVGAPIVFGSYWWGRPWYDEPRVVYREVIREPEVIETIREVPAPIEGAREAAPAQGPLYMNYCDSKQAYFPKVRECPEGWKFIAPNQ